jgi:type II secretory pathway pseudopilin PulG
MISLSLERQKALNAFTLVEAIFMIAVIRITSALALSTISNAPNAELSILAGQTNLDEFKRFSYTALT